MRTTKRGKTNGSEVGLRIPLSLLLFVSGACSLIDQTVWLRQFRLLFGASTLATGAVLAVFMAGMGTGGWWVGRRRRPGSPLRTYAWLELGIGLSAALTPAMLAAARKIYHLSGGSQELGPLVATSLQLVLAVLILGVPTMLMGATLPVAAQAMVGESDLRRRGVAVLYGWNTLGAVLGVMLAGFLMIEVFGNRFTLWMSALGNVMVALGALLLAGRQKSAPESGPNDPELVQPVSSVVLYGAAALASFSFLLMELVWYRLLTPLLGGTTYTFTVILAVILLGIGCGSVVQAVFRKRSSLRTFVWIAAIQGVALVIPFALGDRVAILALRLRPFAAQGFAESVLVWFVLAMIVVFPASFFSGMQFPTLVSLAGAGSRAVSRDVGYLYGWTTFGSVAGSIAGGFGLLSALSAPIAWRLAVMLMVMLTLAIILFRRVPIRSVPFPLLLTALAVVLLVAPGPTAFWRQTPIGAGRADQVVLTGNQLRNLVNERRRITVWQQEGIESMVGVIDQDGLSFLINGKNDGHARFDAGTQVMGGLIGAALHPHPRKAFVIGLGTGSTAGWLAAVPAIEEVQVAELEPATLRVARDCRMVNQDVLNNSKVRLLWGDGREILSNSRQKFDIIFSEPSNPFRAGVASLFTAEFYGTVRDHLSDGGIFLQWVQAYEIDLDTLQTIYATLGATFPTVETWQSDRGDLILAATIEPVSYRRADLDRTFASEPFRSALRNGWAGSGATGFLSHYVAGPSTAEAIGEGARLNTDDRTRIEFSFARTVGERESFDPVYVYQYARARGDERPNVDGELDRDIELARVSMWTSWGMAVPPPGSAPEDLNRRAELHLAYLRGDLAGLTMKPEEIPGTDPVDALIRAEVAVAKGSGAEASLIENLQESHPVEGELVEARLELRRGNPDAAARALSRAFKAYRLDPWPLPFAMSRSFDLTLILAQTAGETARSELHDSLVLPFAAKLFNERRLATRLSLAVQIDSRHCGERTLGAIEDFGRHVPWQRSFLELRARCFSGRGAEADRAVGDLKEFLAREN